MKAPMQLSKSDYMVYLKHPAWLWLKKHQPKKLLPVDAATQAIFDEGNKFEALVEQRFEGMTRLGFEDYQSYLALTKRTADILQAGDKLISQARFEYNKLTCICDIVEQVEPRQLDLYEIKASTKVKPEHIEDLAFQVTVLQGAGYKVRNVYVTHCNNRYVRQGEIAVGEITHTHDVTERVMAKLVSTKSFIAQALSVMQADSCPDMSPGRARMGSYPEWLKIYLSLHKEQPKYSIYDLAHPGAQLIAELENRGITTIADIPVDISLSASHLRQVEVTKLAKPVIHLDKVTQFLSGLQYPLYFLDYETLSSVLPPFDGLRPYEQLPFQYSLHILDSPGSSLRHNEYLHETSQNPVDELTKNLGEAIGESGTVLVWYEKFEKSCNQLLARLQPECAGFMEQLNERIVDLMTPFSKGYYIDQDFFGSASIKKVLPALVPELRHKDLDISEGATAQRLWMQTVLGGVEEGKAELMAQLREYCTLDTLAMVRIYEFLLQLENGGQPPVSQPVQQSLF